MPSRKSNQTPEERAAIKAVQNADWTGVMQRWREMVAEDIEKLRTARRISMRHAHEHWVD